MDGATLGKVIHQDPRFASLSLIMMTSIGSKEDGRFYTDLGFCAYFTKPTSMTDLYNTLVLVSAHKKNNISTVETLQQSSQHDGAQLVAVGRDSYPQQKSHRVLLVEDNPVNQLVAEGMLEDLAVEVDVASTGLEAIAALTKVSSVMPYELIFMDCQMPDMDGYEATRAIRAGEACSINLHIPIIIDLDTHYTFFYILSHEIHPYKPYKCCYNTPDLKESPSQG